MAFWRWRTIMGHPPRNALHLNGNRHFFRGRNSVHSFCGITESISIDALWKRFEIGSLEKFFQLKFNAEKIYIGKRPSMKLRTHRRNERCSSSPLSTLDGIWEATRRAVLGSIHHPTQSPAMLEAQSWRRRDLKFQVNCKYYIWEF